VKIIDKILKKTLDKTRGMMYIYTIEIEEHNKPGE